MAPRARRVEATEDLAPTLEAAFEDGGVQLVTVPVDYSREHAGAGRRAAQPRAAGGIGGRCMKTRAAVLSAMGAPRPMRASKPLAIEEVELEPPGPGEVLVRISAAGLCHSDLSVINGDRPRPMPMALGHEAAGDRRGGRARASPTSPAATMWSCVFVPCCGHCGPAPRAGRRCASRAPRRTAPARCSPGARRLHRADGTPVQPSPRLLGVRRVRDGLAPLAGQDRPGAAARRGGAVRLRRADRRRARWSTRRRCRPAPRWR